MYIQPDAENIERDVGFAKRQDSTQTTDNSDSQSWKFIAPAIIVIVVIFVGSIAAYVYLRKLKRNGRSPKYIPTQFLKRKWEHWKPQSKYANVDRNGSESEQGAVNLTTNQETEEVRETTNVNRNTSVRSVMTLPAYSQKPKENEEVIGREGERAGIDTVVELPETAEEEEDRREGEMESLFQIRQARRREIAERDERRRERREARERNDWTRLEELRREARARRDQNSITNLAQASVSNVNLTAEMLIAEHNARGRERKVSEVSYARVGQVRHDGSRIRSNSHDSERSGLLNGAAPMGVHTRNGSATTLQSLGGPPQPRYRDRSDSGATTNSVTTFNTEQAGSSSDLARLTTTRTRASSHLTTGSISEAESEEGDIGTERLGASDTEFEDAPHPPDYDGHDWGDAPDYMSRANSVAIPRSPGTRTGGVRRIPSVAPRLEIPSIAPSIRIEIPSGPNTPATPATVVGDRTPLSGGVTPRP